MKFRIGNLEVQTASAILDPDHTRLRLGHAARLGRVPRHVYYWNCALEPGGNPARPKYFVVEASLSVTVLTQSGRIHAGRTTAAAQRLLNAAGASDAQALDALLLRTFKPLQVVIPWPALNMSLTARSVVHVIAWVGYKDMFLSPTAGPTQDRYVLSYPENVKFVAVVVGQCVNLDTPAPHILIGGTQKLVTIAPAKGKATDFSQEYDRDVQQKTESNPEEIRRLSNRLRREARRREQRYQDKIGWDEDD